ncbi:MAG TPA: CBS domain-containing protein [Actinomycetales bacterium]|nr:CBS domain-containing protein [Actinomycetales bacterium]
MKIEQLYTPDLACCYLDDSLVTAAERMRHAEISALAVIDENGELVGIISERDLVRALGDVIDPDDVTVAAYATDNVALAAPEDDTAEIEARMLDAGIRHMPVVSEGRLVGMVSMRDLLAGRQRTSTT